jgi:AcrR family transcriptional regulator
MPPQRRAGSATSKTRETILDAAEQVMVEEGYAAVTSRSVAVRAGIHAGNLHYYFPTLDDLFVALLTRGADKNLERMATAIASPHPLKALWRLSSDRRGVALLNELMGAANHRKALRAEVRSLAKSARRMQVVALRELLPQYGLDEDLFPAELLASIIQGTALLVVREELLDVREHGSARAAAEALIDHLEVLRDATSGPD